jgi:cobalamin biosynthesis Mg chelatase CobN
MISSKNIKKILIGLAVIVCQYPLVFSASPGSGSTSKSAHSEVYLSPGRGIEQASADRESHHPSMSSAASNPMNTPRPDEGAMANPAAVNGNGEDLTKTAPSAIRNSEPTKAEVVPSQAKTSELNSHSKAPKMNLKTLKALKKDGANHSGDALSLIWIVIVIVLLFYLIALLAGGLGLGGLIHLLLIVILVLAILWLLRVI